MQPEHREPPYDYAAPPTRIPMNWQTVLLVLLVVLWATAQYGLAAHSLMDLRRRPTVRGNNKVVWALVILGIPIAGALIYTVYGPTSFIRRGPVLAAVQTPAGRSDPQPLPSGSENRTDLHLPLGEIPPRRRESGVSRSDTRVRQQAQPVTQLPELPELDDIDDQTDESLAESTPRSAANRLIRMARRKIRW